MANRTEARSICFGKLPITGDFVRGEGDAPEFRELDDWIQHGLYESQQRLGDGWQERFDALPRDRFLWSDGRGVVIAGWWQASRDRVGRRYPFLLGVRLAKVKTQDYPALPFALADYFRDAERLLQTEFAGLDVVGAIEAAQALTCTIDWSHAHAQQASAQQNDASLLAWQGHADLPELLLSDLEQVSGQHTPPNYCLRWSTRGHASDVSFWLATMARFGRETSRLVMWREATDSAPGSARVIMSPLEPRQFAGMVFADYEYDDAYDMGLGAGEDKRTQNATTRFARTVRTDKQAEAIATLPKEAS